MKRRRLLSFAAFAIIALAAAAAIARPGGGGTFNGKSSGGGGGDAGAIIGLLIDLFELLFRLTIDYPAVGIPVDIIVVIAIIAFVVRTKGNKTADWQTAGGGATFGAARPAFQAPGRMSAREILANLRGFDEDFSLVLFEDFVYALYAEVHERRGKGDAEVQKLGPYLGPNVAQMLHHGPELREVRTVVIGAMRYMNATAGPEGARVTLDFESNYTEERDQGPQTFYAHERWTLSRKGTAKSRPPERARIIGCPNCGAPLSAMRGRTCSYCNKEVHGGDFDWMIESIQVLERSPRPPQLTSSGPEVGTDLPTIVHPQAQRRLSALSGRDPAFSWDVLLRRVGRIFNELQPAWTNRDLGSVRPYLSDSLFQMQLYWVETYKRERLRNVCEQTRITRVELASVMSDKHYDAITLRVHATGLDYTVSDDGGRVVSGSRSRPRAYTEYWTLIRGARVRTKQGAMPDTEKSCPNCGAPLAVNAAGSCTYCKAKVTSGEFDWVLSRIEQDEAYT